MDEIQLDLSEYNFELDAISSDDLVQNFKCNICNVVAIQPLKCCKCEAFYCSMCLSSSIPSYGEMLVYSGDYECYKRCGGKTLVKLSMIENNILNNLSFKCQHADEYGCEAIVKYEFYRKHLIQDCIHKLVLPKVNKIIVLSCRKVDSYIDMTAFYD